MFFESVFRPLATLAEAGTGELATAPMVRVNHALILRRFWRRDPSEWPRYRRDDCVRALSPDRELFSPRHSVALGSALNSTSSRTMSFSPCWAATWIARSPCASGAFKSALYLAKRRIPASPWLAAAEPAPAPPPPPPLRPPRPRPPPPAPAKISKVFEPFVIPSEALAPASSSARIASMSLLLAARISGVAPSPNDASPKP